MVDIQDLVDRVHGLSDLELAVLLSLVSCEHCVIGTPENAVDVLVDELTLISKDVFSLHCAVIDCHPSMTLDDFSSSLLSHTIASPALNDGLGGDDNNSAIPLRSSGGTGGTSTNYFRSSPATPHLPLLLNGRPTRPSFTGSSNALASSLPINATSTPTPTDASLVANVVVAKNLNTAPEVVQLQALELLRTRRIFTSTAMHAAPRPFLLLAVVATERGFRWDGGVGAAANSTDQRAASANNTPHMTAHLNDFISMGHWHDPSHGYPNLEDWENTKEVRLDWGSTHGINVSKQKGPRPASSFSNSDINYLAALSRTVHVDMEVRRYQLNVVAFLRMHRAVAVVGPATGGLSCISPRATKHLAKLAQCLAPLHRLGYVSPALVAVAARKTYLHRIQTVAVGQANMRQAMVYERSMQWGSEKAAVEAILEGLSAGDVIDDVLASVIPPV